MSIAANIAAIRTRMAAACDRSGRAPGQVKLLAVSKGQPVAAIEEAAQSGLLVFAESKVQEARAKIPLCNGSLGWHMIGHLQTNKCRDAVQLFSMIQSVDSLHLAEEINRRCEQAARTMPILLEVNVAGEASKYGYAPAGLLDEIEAINDLPRIEIHGLMTIAPYAASPEKARPFFRQLRELKQECEGRLGAPLGELSMGMTGDYEVAIEEGSTMVRVGTGLFGTRNKSAARTETAASTTG